MCGAELEAELLQKGRGSPPPPRTLWGGGLEWAEKGVEVVVGTVEPVPPGGQLETLFIAS